MAFRLTSRQWFWGIICAATAWSFSGYHWDNDPSNPRWMRKTQDNIIAPLPRSLLVVGEFVFSGVEGVAVSAIERVTRPPGNDRSAADLLDDIQKLKAQNQRLQAQLAAVGTLLGQQEMLGALAEKVIQASVLNPGSSRIHLDKGSSSGVAVGMPVIAPLDEVTVLGRVVAVGQLDCVALLFTDPDPNMSVNADIVRGELRLTTETYLVHGFGGNEMRCETLDVDRPGNLPPPARDDYVLLNDPQYPQLRNMVIGIVEDVRFREDQPKRYNIRIAPPRPIDTLRTVMIVTK